MRSKSQGTGRRKGGQKNEEEGLTTCDLKDREAYREKGGSLDAQRRGKCSMAHKKDGKRLLKDEEGGIKTSSKGNTSLKKKNPFKRVRAKNERYTNRNKEVVAARGRGGGSLRNT